MRIFKWACVICGCVVTLISITAVSILFYAPGAEELRQIGRGVFIRVRKHQSTPGSVEMLNFEYGLNTSFESIPTHLLDAIVASEDHRFYQRSPFYMVGKFIEAGSRCLTGKVTGTRAAACAGNSTITQQLVKILMPGEKQRSYSRKFIELVWALKLEFVMSRREILQLYATRIYLGNGYHGVGMAARGYFRNDVRNLNLRESALLAASVQNPSRNPARMPQKTAGARN